LTQITRLGLGQISIVLNDVFVALRRVATWPYSTGGKYGRGSAMTHRVIGRVRAGIWRISPCCHAFGFFQMDHRLCKFLLRFDFSLEV
jgi:hypothetical protein